MSRGRRWYFVLSDLWFIYLLRESAELESLVFPATRASRNTPKSPLGRRNRASVSGVKSKQPNRTQCLHNPTGWASQIVNQVISQQLGKWQRARGSIKERNKSSCTTLGCVSDETVCLCCAMPCVQHPTLFCTHGLQQISVYGCCGGVDSAKKQRERRIEEAGKDRARWKEGQRDRGGQLPQMQLAHISLVPAFSPADVHHLLNNTSATNLGRI